MYGQVEIEGEFYNVGEEFTMYDTIGIINDLDTWSKAPPGWFTSFTNFAASNTHSFFNVRNVGNTDEAYTNLDTKDMTAFAFRADAISCAWWGSGFSVHHTVEDEATYDRVWLANPLWQANLPFEASLTLKVQQDEKLKANTMMLNAGYGPWGGGYGNFGNHGWGAEASCYTRAPNITTQTQGMPDPSAHFKFPNVIDIPRRAALSAELSLTRYGNALLTALPGPGIVYYYGTDWDDAQKLEAPILFGITVALHGRRLVQQRGALHA